MYCAQLVAVLRKAEVPGCRCGRWLRYDGAPCAPHVPPIARRYAARRTIISRIKKRRNACLRLRARRIAAAAEAAPAGGASFPGPIVPERNIRVHFQRPSNTLFVPAPAHMRQTRAVAAAAPARCRGAARRRPPAAGTLAPPPAAAAGTLGTLAAAAAPAARRGWRRCGSRPAPASGRRASAGKGQ